MAVKEMMCTRLPLGTLLFWTYYSRHQLKFCQTDWSINTCFKNGVPNCASRKQKQKERQQLKTETENNSEALLAG